MEAVAHKLVHVLIILLSAFLALLSVVSFRRTGSRALLFVCLAFLLFSVRELIIFCEVVLSRNADVVLPVLHTPLSHVLTLLILLLFFMGVFPGRVV
jgi:hypothetical protein